MNPTSFKETNKVFGAGNNPNTDQLAVCIADHPLNNGIPTVISKWKLSPEELQRISQSGELWIMVLGNNLPPISPTVFNPFSEHGYSPKNMDL